MSLKSKKELYNVLYKESLTNTYIVCVACNIDCSEIVYIIQEEQYREYQERLILINDIQCVYSSKIERKCMSCHALQHDVIPHA